MNPQYVTPPEHREAAKQALELLLTGWEREVAGADVSDRYRQVMAETAENVRSAHAYGTTPHNLIVHVLSEVFLLPNEPTPATMMTADLEALGAVLEWNDGLPRPYPSLFDNHAEDDE